MRRRSFLAGAAAPALGLPAIGRVGGATADARAGERTTDTILPDTRYETEVTTVEAPESGPTAIVFGGIHGNERAGYRSAENVAGWEFGAGTVVVVPRANRPAIERDRRLGVEGDLNRLFPPGREPESELARALWGVVEDIDPDVLLDLHRSTGIYRVHNGSVGQAIFFTEGKAAEHAAETIDYANDEYVPWYMFAHDFKRGGAVSGTAPLLIHKAHADLRVDGHLVEVTNYLLSLRAQVEWESAVAERLLSHHGIARVDGGDVA